MLSEPLDFHVFELANKYGHIEILQSQIDLLKHEPEYTKVVRHLEDAREAIGNILDSEKLKAAQIEALNRPNNHPQS